jgi:hypothetical protein
MRVTVSESRSSGPVQPPSHSHGLIARSSTRRPGEPALPPYPGSVSPNRLPLLNPTRHPVLYAALALGWLASYIFVSAARHLSYFFFPSPPSTPFPSSGWARRAPGSQGHLLYLPSNVYSSSLRLLGTALLPRHFPRSLKRTFEGRGAAQDVVPAAQVSGTGVPVPLYWPYRRRAPRPRPTRWSGDVYRTGAYPHRRRWGGQGNRSAAAATRGDEHPFRDRQLYHQHGIRCRTDLETGERHRVSQHYSLQL